MDSDNVPMNFAPPPSYEEVMQKEATGRSSNAVVPIAMAAYRGPSKIVVSDETDRLLRRPPPYGLPAPSNQDYVCGPPPRGPGSPAHVSVSINNDFNVAWAAARPERVVTRVDRIDRQSSSSDEVPMTRRDADDRRRKRSDHNISKVMGLIIVCFFCVGAFVTLGYAKGNKVNNRDVCASVNCPYNSYCSTSRDSSRGYVCKCYDGYEGTSCQRRRVVDACQGVTCSYHGVCESQYNGGYQCVCHSGYSGSNCHYEGITLDDLNKPCFGLNCGPYGYCEHPVCRCYDGSVGISCENNVSTVSKTTTSTPTSTTPSLSKTSAPTPTPLHEIDFSKLDFNSKFSTYCLKSPCEAHGGGLCITVGNRYYCCKQDSGCLSYVITDDKD